MNRLICLWVILCLSYTCGTPVNYEQVGGFFEGDMSISPEEIAELQKPTRTGLIDTRYRWPRRTIPYVIDASFSPAERDLIRRALANIQSLTCLSIVPRTNERDYVQFQSQNSGCWANVGYGTGVRTINLQRGGCTYYGVAQHEFLHALGFFHMQSSTDRDRYVRIVWGNILPGTEHNFQIMSGITNFGIPYDYDSVMHYPANAFGRNNAQTIVPLNPSARIGQRNGLSNYDIMRVRAMYC